MIFGALASAHNHHIKCINGLNETIQCSIIHRNTLHKRLKIIVIPGLDIGGGDSYSIQNVYSLVLARILAR
jgi:sugar diacid utilization regulator